MTEKEFKSKYDEIIEWCINETNKITEKLKKENKMQGLDTNKLEYAQIHQEFENKIKKLKEEYKSTY
ncbi:MAG TPA: hypothetical protein OIM45_04835 [Clostridiaceae bacterium]|nr:hypothetical protein [Clostridiaceae bacterium]